MAPVPVPAVVNDLALMELQAETLFRFDARGDLHQTNEPGAHPAPRVFVGTTSEGSVIRFRGDVDRETRARISSSDDAKRSIEGRTYEGPAFRFADPLPAPGRETRRVTPEQGALLRDFPELRVELPWRDPCFAIVVDALAVSICFSSRTSARAAEAGVATLPAYQGRGFARSALGAWAAEIGTRGLIPLYSTSWENAASQAVARSLRLVRYGVDLSIS